MLPLVFSLLSLVAGALPSSAAGVDDATRSAAGLLRRSVRVASNNYDYQVYVPPARNEKKNSSEKTPVILFLHGIGQRGTGGFVPAGGAKGMMVEGYLKRANAIIVLPQCRPGKYWSDAEMTRMSLAAVDDAIETYGGDPERVYLVGVSMGGYGAWGIAAEHRGRFAAIVPICGGSPLRSGDRFTTIARGIGRTPVWAFHGAEDRVVPVAESRGIIAALKAQGGDVRYNEYAGVGHSVWLNALGESELLPWLFSKRLAR